MPGNREAQFGDSIVNSTAGPIRTRYSPVSDLGFGPRFCGRSLRSSRQRLQADATRIECSDALAWMARAPAGSFDLILLDPPFGSDLAERALPLAWAAGWPT